MARRTRNAALTVMAMITNTLSAEGTLGTLIGSGYTISAFPKAIGNTHA